MTIGIAVVAALDVLPQDVTCGDLCLDGWLHVWGCQFSLVVGEVHPRHKNLRLTLFSHLVKRPQS